MPDLTTILGTALHGANVGCHYVREFDRKSCEPGSARHSVAAIPDAEREALEFGLAGLRVERALPEGWDLHLYSLGLGEWCADAAPPIFVSEEDQPVLASYQATPTAALTALAEALEARRA